MASEEISGSLAPNTGAWRRGPRIFKFNLEICVFVLCEFLQPPSVGQNESTLRAYFKTKTSVLVTRKLNYQHPGNS